jgi:hypothetical protein
MNASPVTSTTSSWDHPSCFISSLVAGTIIFFDPFSIQQLRIAPTVGCSREISRAIDSLTITQQGASSAGISG